MTSPDRPELSVPIAERLRRQIEFILEVDRLKSVLRRSYLVDGTRHENTAEHSWHLTVLALVLSEYSNIPVDALHVLKMLIVHDIVEIDAGDTFVYDTAGNLAKADREKQAALRLFGLLPPDQAKEITLLWQEFEQRQTPNARFAAALDRLMPLLHNWSTGGRSWRENGVTADQVLALNQRIAEGSVPLWDYAQSLIADAVAQHSLPEKPQ